MKTPDYLPRSSAIGSRRAPACEKVRYDPVETEKINERIMSVFTKAFFAAHEGEGCEDPAPVSSSSACRVQARL
ncbi:MAG: hypothetical protein R3C54_16585 [Parvularculaceae bacterium]